MEERKDYKLKNYRVFGSDLRDDCKLIQCDTAEEAVKAWIDLQEKYPTCVSIDADTKALAKKLYTWVNNNIAEVVIGTMKYDIDSSKLVDGVHSRLKDESKIDKEDLYPFVMG